MVVATLYQITLQKTFSFLKSGVWNACENNPFSFCPTKIINDLMPFAYSETENMADIHLLLTSGQIRNLHLMKMNYDLRKELNLVLPMLTENVCRNLRKLSIPKCLASDVSLVENVLRLCIHLEDVYSEIMFDLNALRNCKEMRYLRFRAERTEVFNFTSQADFDALRSLNIVEIFAFSLRYEYCFVDPEAMAKVLLNCHNLSSIGYVDSLMPLAHILEKENNPPPYFRLRRCLWGYSDWDIRNLRYLKDYKNFYPEYIKNAVSFYPLVEDLELLVFHKDCLQYLSSLQHLTFLCVSLYHIGRDDDDCISVITSILIKMGPQLRYFALEMKNTVSLCAICDQCPNLESLFLINPSVNEKEEPSLCLKHLKRFSCVYCDREVLMFVFSSCPNLNVLSLSQAQCLEDGLLTNILKRNPLSQLKIVSISKCSLSKEGLRLLLLSVPSIENLYIGNKEREVADLISELNLGTQRRNLAIRADLESKNFFFRKKYWYTL